MKWRPRGGALRATATATATAEGRLLPSVSVHCLAICRCAFLRLASRCHIRACVRVCVRGFFWFLVFGFLGVPLPRSAVLVVVVFVSSRRHPPARQCAAAGVQSSEDNAYKDREGW